MASKMAKRLKRLAASLVFLREKKSAVPGDQFEVLLVQRSRTMKFATSTWVFPGGVYDIADGNGVHDGLSFSTDVGFYVKYVCGKRLKRQVFYRCRKKLQIVQCETSSRGNLA